MAGEESGDEGASHAKPIRTQGVATGVGAWYQMYDKESGRFFFFNQTTRTTAWGLPLRECVPEDERVPHSRAWDSDWVCCIDAQSGKKFFQSVKIRRVQWTAPLMFRADLARFPYFSTKRISMVGAGNIAGALRPKLEKQSSVSELIGRISIEDVLSDAQTCAAYHRFLVATHAEENILFWGAAEVYRMGEWQGMKILGHASVDVHNLDVEGYALIQSQMVATRASQRVGFVSTKRMSAGREARLIYDRFLKPDAPLEVCVERKIADRVLDAITSRHVDADRSLFVEAQEEVLRNMGEDLLPRFLRVALSPEDETVGTKGRKFTSDAVVRTALHRLAGVSLD